MRKINLIRLSLIAVIVVGLSGCTVHPEGEHAERDAATKAGTSFEKPVESRTLAPLPISPTREQLVNYALQSNGDLEQRYWEWRAAIEQIPIDGTQPTSLAISLSTAADNGSFSLDRTVITAANDPMTDIAFPGKLSVAARRSLENARASGMRFRKAQFELRRQVLSVYDDCVLAMNLIDLAEQNVQLLKTIVMVTEAKNRSGATPQQDVLRATNELDLAENDLESTRSQFPIQIATLNALLGRLPRAAISISSRLPTTPPVRATDQELLERAVKVSPELTALADEIRAKHEDIHLARLQYYPDFDLAASTDLAGITQALMGEFTVPMLRHEALDAAIRQAQARLNATVSMRQQAKLDLAARLVDDIATLRDSDRQLKLLDQTILPRLREIISIAQTRYQTGGESLTDVINSQRSLVDTLRLEASLQVYRDKRVLDIESLDAIGLQ